MSVSVSVCVCVCVCVRESMVYTTKMRKVGHAHDSKPKKVFQEKKERKRER